MASRNSEFQFLPTDPEELVASLMNLYQAVTGVSIAPESPERLFLQWIAAAILLERGMNNYTGNQNIPSRAEGENLDALAELFYQKERPEAVPAQCTVRFSISKAQTFDVLVPAGTRVTDAGGALAWATQEDGYVKAGETSVELPVVCQSAGTAGNGYVPGQINKVVDLYDYCAGCANTTTSGGGSNRATDEEFYELLRLSMDAYSCAGARGGYLYFAKQVSTEIGDVAAVAPENEPGVVKLYVLLKNGEPAGEELKQKVLEACSSDTRRPLTDFVSVEDPAMVEYDIRLTYYMDRADLPNSAHVRAAVDQAVAEYTAWQSGKLGRDINPDRLRRLLYAAGVKRVELEEPRFTRLSDGHTGAVPQVARLKNLSVTDGGFEDE